MYRHILSLSRIVMTEKGIRVARFDCNTDMSLSGICESVDSNLKNVVLDMTDLDARVLSCRSVWEQRLKPAGQKEEKRNKNFLIIIKSIIELSKNINNLYSELQSSGAGTSSRVGRAYSRWAGYDVMSLHDNELMNMNELVLTLPPKPSSHFAWINIFANPADLERFARVFLH